jgi:hypothetical protein
VSTLVKPELGSGATVAIGSDRYPATVIDIVLFKSGTRVGEIREVLVQFDATEVVGGKWPDLEYKYTPDSQGRQLWFHVKANGKFTCNGIGIGFGHRRKYHDPHF